MRISRRVLISISKSRVHIHHDHSSYNRPIVLHIPPGDRCLADQVRLPCQSRTLSSLSPVKHAFDQALLLLGFETGGSRIESPPKPNASHHAAVRHNVWSSWGTSLCHSLYSVHRRWYDMSYDQAVRARRVFWWVTKLLWIW